MQKIKDLSDAKKEIKETIDQEGPYTRNILRCILRIVDKEFGKDVANDLIDEFDLESYGMNKE